MIKPAILLAAIVTLFEVAHFIFGYRLIYAIGYGAFSMLALVIALTFLWLWLRRSTPLALGMAFSWSGAACIMAWWWIYNLLEAPAWMQNSPYLFVFLSVYLVGAVLHLEVIGRSFALSRIATFAPVAGVVLLSVLAARYA